MHLRKEEDKSNLSSVMQLSITTLRHWDSLEGEKKSFSFQIFEFAKILISHKSFQSTLTEPHPPSDTVDGIPNLSVCEISINTTNSC